MVMVAILAPHSATPAEPAAEPPVAKYVGVYTHPPSTVGALDPAIKAYRVPDGPLMGNGDIAVAVGATTTSDQTFYVSKSDLSQSARGVGGLTYKFGDAAADTAGYRQEQDLYRAEVRSVIPLARTTLRMRSWTADDANVLVTDLTATGAAVDVELRLWSHAGSLKTQAGAEDGLLWSTRAAGGTVGSPPQPFSSKVAMCTRVMGATPVCTTDGKSASTARFTLPAGQTVRVVTAVAGGYQVEDHIARAKALAASLTHQRIEALAAAHRQWWQAYWSRSSVTLHDELVEKFYYGALYVLGCASRAGSVAPGLAGPWHLNGPICWSNKYTLDYNFEALYWGVYSSNHPELAAPYYDVILKLIPAGRQLATEHGTAGILFSVNAHAWGGFTDTRTLNMKGNASLAALNFMMHYSYTRDERFLVDKAWPLLIGVAEFWEANLERDPATGRWTILESGAREGQHDTNPITDLGEVRTLFRFLLETCDALEGKPSGGAAIHIDAARRARWRSFAAELSPYPTIVLDGKTVFKEAENRKKMNLGGAGDNSDVLDHVFPAEALSLGSDPALLQIARDTVAALNPEAGKASWFQANSFPKIYTQAVRSGYPAAPILDHFKQLLAGRQPYDDRGDHAQLRDNLTINPPAHSFENVSAIEAIDSMLLQSHDHVIRVFPNWVPGRDASFRNLRAYGAFLVSSEYQHGAVAYVDITSEAGGLCTLASPWPGRAARITRTGVAASSLRGQTLAFPTRPGETLHLVAQ